MFMLMCVFAKVLKPLYSLYLTTPTSTRYFLVKEVGVCLINRTHKKSFVKFKSVARSFEKL